MLRRRRKRRLLLLLLARLRKARATENLLPILLREPQTPRRPSKPQPITEGPILEETRRKRIIRIRSEG